MDNQMLETDWEDKENCICTHTHTPLGAWFSLSIKKKAQSTKQGGWKEHRDSVIHRQVALIGLSWVGSSHGSPAYEDWGCFPIQKVLPCFCVFHKLEKPVFTFS